jgi:hypothetical protein
MKLGSSEINRLRERVETLKTRGPWKLQSDKMDNRWVEALGPDYMEILIGGWFRFVSDKQGRGCRNERAGAGAARRVELLSDPLRSEIVRKRGQDRGKESKEGEPVQQIRTVHDNLRESTLVFQGGTVRLWERMLCQSKQAMQS